MKSTEIKKEVKASYTTNLEGKLINSKIFIVDKVKTNRIFMNMEYIRCPITKVIVVNKDLFKEE